VGILDFGFWILDWVVDLSHAAGTGAIPCGKDDARCFPHFAFDLAWRYTGRMNARPQFSLRFLFFAIAAAAVIAAEAGAFMPPVALAVGISVSLLSCAAIVAGLVYARDFTRAFCVGALATLVAARFVAASHAPSGLTLATVFYSMIPPWLATKYMNSYGIEYSVLWVFAIAGGLAAVFVRRLAVGESDNHPPRSGERI